MRISLVQSPSSRDDLSELAPPLSLLMIAAALREDDFDVTIVDLNVLAIAGARLADEHFFERAQAIIESTAPDAVGFTSMAFESHVSLELARRLKAAQPQLRIILGGPHFSAIASGVLQYYPWVDYVVTGEGEAAARQLFACRAGRKRDGALPNVARLVNGQFRLDRQLKPNATLDALPVPAYDLVDLDLYYGLNPSRTLDFEHARGCALKCAFCYSAVHWGHGEQAKQIDRILSDIERHAGLGARHLFFVADNFLNSKQFARALAEEMAQAGVGVTWRGYATLAQLTEPVVDSLARSACTDLFVGVDAVGEQTKKVFQKSYYKGEDNLTSYLSRCFGHGIRPTCAFMVQPELSAKHEEETEAAVRVAVLAYNLGCGVRLNPLSVYSGTGLDGSSMPFPVRHSDEKTRLLLDAHWMSRENPLARWTIRNSIRSTARSARPIGMKVSFEPPM